MKKLLIKILFVSLSFLSLALSCNGEPTSEKVSTNGSIVTFEYILYNNLTNDITAPIKERLDKDVPQVVKFLKLTEPFLVKVRIWNDETDFYDVMLDDIGQKYPGATGYVTYNEVRVLNRSNLPKTVLHEFVHVASMRVNRSIPNNPRWLWEAAAVFASDDFVDPKTLSYMVDGNYPTLSELNKDFNLGGQKIYSVGYVLIEYIITQWSIDSVVELIKTNGNIQNVLKISVSDFEKGWYNFLETRYL